MAPLWSMHRRVGQQRGSRIAVERLDSALYSPTASTSSSPSAGGAVRKASRSCAAAFAARACGRGAVLVDADVLLRQRDALTCRAARTRLGRRATASPVTILCDARAADESWWSRRSPRRGRRTRRRRLLEEAADSLGDRLFENAARRLGAATTIGVPSRLKGSPRRARLVLCTMDAVHEELEVDLLSRRRHRCIFGRARRRRWLRDLLEAVPPRSRSGRLAHRASNSAPSSPILSRALPRPALLAPRRSRAASLVASNTFALACGRLRAAFCFEPSRGRPCGSNSSLRPRSTARRRDRRHTGAFSAASCTRPPRRASGDVSKKGSRRWSSHICAPAGCRRDGTRTRAHSESGRAWRSRARSLFRPRIESRSFARSRQHRAEPRPLAPTAHDPPAGVGRSRAARLRRCVAIRGRRTARTAATMWVAHQWPRARLLARVLRARRQRRAASSQRRLARIATRTRTSRAVAVRA